MFRDFIKAENTVLVAFDSHGAFRHEHSLFEQVASQTVPLGQQCQLSPQSIASFSMQHPIKECEYLFKQHVALAGQPVSLCVLDVSLGLLVCFRQYFESRGVATDLNPD